MITEAHIEYFKGIKECDIKDIAKINLFIGKNNCGKSNLLEAIYLAGKEFVEDALTKIIRQRSNRSSGRELFYFFNK